MAAELRAEGRRGDQAFERWLRRRDAWLLHFARRFLDARQN